MKTIFAALSLALLSVPVSAAAPSADGGSKPAKASAAKEKQYCIEYEASTGSRISGRECYTKKQWQALGVDIDKLTNR